MTVTHLPVNPHHLHARFMSNVEIGPGGQATLVAPTQPEFSIASSVTSATQQAVPSLSSAVDSTMNITSSFSAPAAPTTSGLVEVSTTVVVTSEIFEVSSTVLPSPSMASSSPSDSVSAPTTSVSTPTTSVATTTFLAVPTSEASTSADSASTVSSSSSTTALPTSLAATATSSVTNTSATKEPTLYIGIVLGTIIVIACFAAFIAWWFRLRTHSRRRKKSVAVPWASRPESSLSSFVDTDSLEKGESLNPSRRTWEPRGDRDAGEPRRTKSYLQDINPPVKRRSLPILSTPSPPPATYPFYGHTPPQYPAPYPSSLLSTSPMSAGPLKESVAYPLPNSARLPQYNYLQPNMNVHPNPPSVRMQFLTDPEFGTPRESMIKPRYLSLDEGLKVPWDTETPALALKPSYLHLPDEGPSSPASLSDRHIQAQEIRPSDDLPASGSQSQGGTWSSGIKANLAYAFNAVAKAAGGTYSDEEYDKLSPLPSRNASRNRKKDIQPEKNTGVPIRETGWVQSPTLEETSEGRGIVHIRSSFSSEGLLPFPGTIDSASASLSSGLGIGMGLESYRGIDHAFTPPLSSQSTITSRQNSTASFKSTAALVVRKKNYSVRSTGSTQSSAGSVFKLASRSQSQRRPKYAYGEEMTAVSRRGSGMSSRAPRLPTLPSFSRSRSRFSLSRMSTLRSMKSTQSIMTVLTDREEMARKALIERQKRVSLY
ncbi:hypothetical protein J3R30DRAFT_2082549 [Lentinula aciculospora]|uniref:Uncharacterized protein n=1 Tax=Lentinula aciculospora TaxID=153920 RepID=A0A9W8ZU92_9AGAR|nr:hypothetical protein J3R30DRAFT_2082549 [Lentinula aciculospora]